MSNTTIKVLCYKSLTHSDVTTEIAKSGRLVLPRAQVTACLQRLLALGSAGGAPGKGRAGSLCGAVPLVSERGCCRPNCPNPGPGPFAASSSLDSGVDRGEWLGAHFAALDHSQFMHDMDGKVWNFQLKTWHNVVASGGRATYVLENTGTPRRVLGSIRRFG